MNMEVIRSCSWSTLTDYSPHLMPHKQSTLTDLSSPHESVHSQYRYWLLSLTPHVSVHSQCLLTIVISSSCDCTQSRLTDYCPCHLMCLYTVKTHRLLSLPPHISLQSQDSLTIVLASSCVCTQSTLTDYCPCLLMCLYTVNTYWLLSLPPHVSVQSTLTDYCPCLLMCLYTVNAHWLFSETVLRHHRSAFTAGQLLGDNNAWAVKGIILQCTDLMSKSWDIPLKIPVFARIAS